MTFKYYAALVVLAVSVLGVGAWLLMPQMFETYDSCVENKVHETPSTLAQAILLEACHVAYRKAKPSAQEKQDARCLLDKLTGAPSWVVALSRLEECGATHWQ